MNKLYTITGISIVALSLFSGSALAHHTHAPRGHHHHPKIVTGHKIVHKRPHVAVKVHKMSPAAHKYKRLISLELSNPHPNMRKLRILRHAVAHEQARYAHYSQHLSWSL